MLTVCWVTASRYADVKRMADIDITKFVANHRRLIRWRVRTLKSNKCGLTKWIPSGGRLKKTGRFPVDTSEGHTIRLGRDNKTRHSHSDLCSESSSLHPSSAQGHTKHCLHSSQHQERCGDNVSFSRNKDVLHSTAPWTCGHPNNANVRRSTSDSIRVKEENHTRTPPGRTLTVSSTDSGVRHVFDSPSCSTRDFIVAKVQQKQSQSCTVTNAQKSVEWDVRFAEGNFVNGCKEYVELLHTPVSQSSILSSQPNSTSQNPLSDDSYIYCAFSQECRVPKRTMAVQWPLAPISDNELNLASLLKHATILEANVLKIIMEKDTFLQTHFCHSGYMYSPIQNARG